MSSRLDGLQSKQTLGLALVRCCWRTASDSPAKTLRDRIYQSDKLLCIQLAQSGRARCPPHRHFEKILVQIKGATA